MDDLSDSALVEGDGSGVLGGLDLEGDVFLLEEGL